MTVEQSRDLLGLDQAMRGVLVDSAPGGVERIKRYNAARQRLRLPPYHLASIGDVAEAIGCVGGCRAHHEHGVRVVEARVGCRAHTKAGS